MLYFSNRTQPTYVIYTLHIQKIVGNDFVWIIYKHDSSPFESCLTPLVYTEASCRGAAQERDESDCGLVLIAFCQYWIPDSCSRELYSLAGTGENWILLEELWSGAVVSTIVCTVLLKETLAVYFVHRKWYVRISDVSWETKMRGYSVIYITRIGLILHTSTMSYITFTDLYSQSLNLSKINILNSILLEIGDSNDTY